MPDETDATKYQGRGQVKKHFGDNGLDQMNQPLGVCSTASDDLVVADTFNNQIQIIAGDKLTCFGEEGTKDGQFDHVHDVCVTKNGRIVASDWGNHRIQIFDEQGNFIRNFGGEGDGKLHHPYGVATDDKGQIYVCDYDNRRYQVFSGEEGKLVHEYTLRNLKPTYISVASNGRVAITDWVNGRVYVHDLVRVHGQETHKWTHFGSQGVNKSEFLNPRGVAQDANGNIIVCDNSNHRVQILTSKGEFVACFGSKGGKSGSKLGEMNGPQGVCLLSDGGIAVCDTFNNRVQIF